jgi:DNA-binding transcriptional ArsR family regulator
MTAPEAKYHVGELEKRSLVHIPFEYEGEGEASITQEGRAYVFRHNLLHSVPRKTELRAGLQDRATDAALPALGDERDAIIENLVLDFLREAKSARTAAHVAAGISRPTAAVMSSLKRLAKGGMVEERNARDGSSWFMLNGLGLKWPDL